MHEGIQGLFVTAWCLRAFVVTVPGPAQRRIGYHDAYIWLVLPASSRSRKPSPSRLKPNTTNMMARPGKVDK
jgi:hypothetical protein